MEQSQGTSRTLSGTGTGALDAARILESLFVAFVLFVSSGAVFQVIARPGGQDQVAFNSTSLDGPLLAASFAVAAGLVLGCWRSVVRDARAAWPLWLLPLLAIASTAWSTDPGRTAHSAANLTMSMVFAAYMAHRFDAASQIKLVAAVLGFTLFASIVTVFVDPAIAIEPGVHQGEWRGLFITKNVFGRIMALAFVSFTILGTYGRRGRTLAWIAAAAAVAVIWESHSRTSLLIAIAAAGWILGQAILRRWPPGRIAIAVGIALVLSGLALIVWQQRNSLTAGSASDGETLTGRTVLWAVVGAKILARPVLGYGYTAFWTGSTGEYVDVWRLVGWRPPHAHNGFLDVALDLGVPGLVVTFAVIVESWYRCLRAAETDRAARCWAGCIVLLLVLSNLTESGLLRSNVFWILFASTSTIAFRQTKNGGSAHAKELMEETNDVS